MFGVAVHGQNLAEKVKGWEQRANMNRVAGINWGPYNHIDQNHAHYTRVEEGVCSLEATHQLYESCKRYILIIPRSLG